MEAKIFACHYSGYTKRGANHIFQFFLWQTNFFAKRPRPGPMDPFLLLLATTAQIGGQLTQCRIHSLVNDIGPVSPSARNLEFIFDSDIVKKMDQT